MVTRAGSPPNCAMLSCTHRSAAIWSSKATLPAASLSPSLNSGNDRNPSAPSRYCSVTTSMFCATRLVGRCPSPLPATFAPLWIQANTGNGSAGCGLGVCTSTQRHSSVPRLAMALFQPSAGCTHGVAAGWRRALAPMAQSAAGAPAQRTQRRRGKENCTKHCAAVVLPLAAHRAMIGAHLGSCDRRYSKRAGAEHTTARKQQRRKTQHRCSQARTRACQAAWKTAVAEATLRLSTLPLPRIDNCRSQSRANARSMPSLSAPIT